MDGYRKTRTGSKVTLHDVAIFAACKRGSVEYDAKWLDKATDIARAEERMGYRPPVFVKHNGGFRGTVADEAAQGRMANFRRQKVRVNGELREGIVCDLVDLDPATAERVESHSLCGRSIETIAPQTRNKIDGVALLGRTAPFHALAQGSEPEHHEFSLVDPANAESILVSHQDIATEFSMMPPPGGAPTPGGAPAPAQPQQGGGADAILKQIIALLQPVLGGGSQAAPVAHPPAAGAQASSAQRMQADEPTAPAAADEAPVMFETPASDAPAVNLELEAEKLKLQREAAEFAAKQAAEAEAAAVAAKTEADLQNLFGALRAEGKVFSEDYVRGQVQRFGLEDFNSNLRPLLRTAPVAPTQFNAGAPASAPAPASPAVRVAPGADPDLAEFAAASPELRRVAFAAAQEYDAEAKRDPRWANADNPRKLFIAGEVRRHRTEV